MQKKKAQGGEPLDNRVTLSETAENATNENQATQADEKVFTIPPAPVTIDQAAAKYENLKALFARKAAFKTSLIRLDKIMDELAKDDNPLESDGAKLVFSVGRYHSDDVLKIGNKFVIVQAVEFLKAKIEETLCTVEAEILDTY